MKKIFLCAAAIFLLTGCGSVTCTSSRGEGVEAISIKETAKVDGKNNVTELTYEYTIGNKEYAEYMCNQLKANPGEYAGVEKIDVDCSSSKVTLKIKMKSNITDESQILTKEKFVDSATKSGFKCN